MRYTSLTIALVLLWVFIPAHQARCAAPDEQATVTEIRPPVRIAIYDHSGGSAVGPGALMQFLTEDNGFACKVVTPQEIRDGSLKDFDVLIMPGGSGSKQAANLEDAGREIIRDFVRSGGGYVGICAGSYLATNDYTWSLGLINARVVDRAHWARGSGEVTLTLTDAGKQTLSHRDTEVRVAYNQGPLLALADKPELPPYEPLAIYATEIAKKGAPEGVMIGTTAIARSTFGAGRVICYSPHPERPDGPNHLIIHGIHWAARKDAP